MHPSEELKLLIAAIDRGNIANVHRRENHIFSEKLIRRAKRLKQNAEDALLATRYKEKINTQSKAALTALKALCKVGHEHESKQYRLVIEAALIKPKIPTKAHLDKIIQALEISEKATRIVGSRKNADLKQKIADLAARMLFEDLKIKPIHNSGFSTNKFREETGYPCASGDASIYDDIMTALSIILDLEFSDPILRKARNRTRKVE